MKYSTKYLIRTVTAVLMCTVLLLPVHGASYEKEYLFLEDLHENEYMDRQLDREPSDSSSRVERATSKTEDTKEYQEKSYVTRNADFSFRLEEDAALVEYVMVVIPEGKTMTIDKDVTLTIYGQLVIHGKLNNNGTIILGDERALSRYDEYNNNPGASQLIVMGEMTNSGSITIVNGRLENAAGATSTNKGTITIANKNDTLTGLANTTTKKSGEVIGGHFINTGTIYVQNTGGYGIRNLSGASFDNNGKIILSPSSTTRGVISGNRPTMKTE